MTATDISVIIPVFNESENLDVFYRRLSQTLSDLTDSYQVIFVNDGSTDDSLLKIKALSKTFKNIYFINLSRNFGHQIAVSAGIDVCTSNCTVVIDADLQDPPEVIAELYQKYKEGYDVVYAKRLQRKGESLFKKVSASLFYRILNKITAVDIPIDTGDFRIIDQRVVTKLKQMPEKHKFLRGQIAWLGYKQTFITYNRNSRNRGKSGYSVSKMFKLAFDAITGFSNKPLLYVTRLGFLISILSFFIILFAIFSHFVLEQTITGWTSLIISVSFLGGIQLLAIGVIGEYISRINENVKQRPLYIVESSNIEAEGVEQPVVS